MYVAKHYVRINGKMYLNGEKIPEELTAEKVAWLVEKGAIEEVAPVDAAAEYTEPEQENAEVEKPEEAPEDETDEDMEAPEIDVMAGIVAEKQEEAPKKTARKTAAKKTTERRKSK